MPQPLRLLLTLLIALSVIVAPVSGALAMSGMHDTVDSAGVQCMDSGRDFADTGYADQAGTPAGFAQTSDGAHCCELPCEKCGHCQFSGLPFMTGAGTNYDTALQPSPVTAVSDVPPDSAFHPPRRP
jgi:hypothetical protein